MKLMFCGIYSLVLTVSLPDALLRLLRFPPGFFFNHKRNRTMCEGSLILFAFDFLLLFFAHLVLEVKQEACHQPFQKLWFTGG